MNLAWGKKRKERQKEQTPNSAAEKILQAPRSTARTGYYSLRGIRMGFANPLLICDENNHRRTADQRPPVRAAHSGAGRREGIEQLDSVQ